MTSIVHVCHFIRKLWRTFKGMKYTYCMRSRVRKVFIFIVRKVSFYNLVTITPRYQATLNIQINLKCFFPRIAKSLLGPPHSYVSCSLLVHRPFLAISQQKVKKWTYSLRSVSPSRRLASILMYMQHVLRTAARVFITFDEWHFSNFV